MCIRDRANTTFTAALVKDNDDAPATANVILTTTYRGTGASVIAGRQAEVKTTTNFEIAYVVKPVEIGGLTITNILNITDKEIIEFSSNITERAYDEITYVWSVDDQYGTIEETTPGSANFIPNLLSTTDSVEATVTLTATARGTGTLATLNEITTKSVSDSFDIEFTIKDVIVEDAVITGNTNVRYGTSTQLDIDLVGGFYDVVAYSWAIADPSLGCLLYTSPSPRDS